MLDCGKHLILKYHKKIGQQIGKKTKIAQNSNVKRSNIHLMVILFQIFQSRCIYQFIE